MTDAAFVWMWYVAKLDHSSRIKWMANQDSQGQTLLHYWVTTHSLQELPNELRSPHLLTIKNSSGQDVFDVAQIHQNLDQLPLEVLQEWGNENP
jgi:hypothetical protein